MAVMKNKKLFSVMYAATVDNEEISFVSFLIHNNKKSAKKWAINHCRETFLEESGASKHKVKIMQIPDFLINSIEVNKVEL